jgi:hypothetical protein
MVATKLAVGCALYALADAEIHDHRDLQRARTKKPRSNWKGEGRDGVSNTLNGHLNKMFPKVKPCSEWTAQELQELQAELFAHRNTDFNEIYDDSSDNRKMHKATLEEYQQHWEVLNGHADRNPHLKEMHRDAHCNEAVMWLVHHVNAPEQQTVFARKTVPTLSTKSHKCGDNMSESETALCSAASGTETCMECHSNSGMPFQDPDLDGKIAEDPRHPGLARSRRCDQNYDPPCGACEGIGGPYWGDGVTHFQPTNCEVVSLPEDVPESERTTPELGTQFTVHQLGSDRLSRVQNSGGLFTMYSQIRSTLWYDGAVDENFDAVAEDGMMKLRHDTFYENYPYKLVDHGLVSELHFQTKAQRESNITGPMVSLLHGLLGYGQYLGGCTCVGDPVGVPILGGMLNINGELHSAFKNDATYLGRIKMGIEYDGYKMGDRGHGDMKSKRDMIVDHYSKWFLHLFVDADPESPTYNQAVRFYGPYSGFAVYITMDKSQPPQYVFETACVENGWGTPEFKLPWNQCKDKPLSSYKCMNVEKKMPEVCAPYGMESPTNTGSMVSGNFGSFWMPDVMQPDVLV